MTMPLTFFWNQLKIYIKTFIFISVMMFILSEFFKEQHQLDGNGDKRESRTRKDGITELQEKKKKSLINKIIKNGNKFNSINDSSSFAYASLLCDDVMIDAVRVLLYSLRESKSTIPFILLVLPQVKQTEDLIKLGAKLEWIDPLSYPFKVTAEKTAINKMCRYSKLQIWKMTQYSKIVFVDVDCLIVQNLDASFKWPQFSAVRDAGDTFNTGLFVLEPSLETFKKMKSQYMQAPSYNQGDQGFLNWYFRNENKMALPVKYNTVSKHKIQATWPLLKRQTKMIHFTSETKPWNFFSGSHKFWKQNFDIGTFYLWSRTFRTVTEKLKIDVFDPKRSMWLNSKRVPEICEASFASLYQDSSLSSFSSLLSNSNSNLHSLAPSNFPFISSDQLREEEGRLANKLSVLIITWKSLDNLHATIDHYQSFSLSHIVHKVYVSWNPSNGSVPPTLLNKKCKQFQDGIDGIGIGSIPPNIKDNDKKTENDHKWCPPLEILIRRYESWNNIWNPILNVATKAIFMANDEHFADAEKLEIALEVWKDNQYGLVGFFARYHGRQKYVDPELVTTADPNEIDILSLLGMSSTLSSLPSSSSLPLYPLQAPLGAMGIGNLMGGAMGIGSSSLVDENWSWSYNLTSIRRPKPYSLLSSQLLLLSHDYFFIYSCLLPERIHRFIDEQPEDSTDFAMNLLAAGLSGVKPILIKHDFKNDPEQFKYSESWATMRANLLRDLMKLFTGGNKDTLTFNAISASQFNKIPFKKRSAKQWNHV